MLDMTIMEDEPLVILTTECEFQPAQDELIRRYLPLKEQLVRRHTALTALQQADHDDAQQDAILWILEAIRRYRTDEYIKPGGCHFRSFLQRVLDARCIDFLRRLQRFRNHFPLTGGALPAASTSSSGKDRPHNRATPGERAEGVQGAQELGLRARLLEQLTQLDGPSRQLWDLLARGMPLRKIAIVLNVSYDAAKRRRRKLFANLCSSLSDSERVSSWRRSARGPTMIDAHQQSSDKPGCGFAVLTPDQRRALASKGGKAVQAQGKAPLFTSESGRKAGRKGGVRAHALGRGHAFTPAEAAAAGRKSGLVRARRRQKEDTPEERDAGTSRLDGLGAMGHEDS
jgi:RNA polymerase sigma factor (sigma-70 family)